MHTDDFHQRWRLVLGSIVIAVAATPLAYLLVLMLGVQPPWFWRVVALVVAIIIVVMQLIIHYVPHFAASSLLSFLMPQDARDRGIAFSHAEAMAVRGETEAATREYHRLLSMGPDDVPLHRAAAEFFSKTDPQMAASVFQRLRQLPNASSTDEHYATHRLVDLYGGPLQNPGRMRVELRRMVDRFPGTADAAGAEIALKRLRDEAQG